MLKREYPARTGPRRGVARLGVVVLVCACGPRGGGDAGEDSTGSDSSGPGESESGESGSTDDASTDTESTGEPDVPPDLPGVDPCDDAPTPGDERTAWVEEFDGGEGVVIADLLGEQSGEVFVVATANVPAQPSILIAAHAEADGNEIWTNTVPVEGLRLASAAAMDSDGGFVVVGETEDLMGEPDAWVGRFDAAGVLDWQITIDAPATSEEQVSDGGLDVSVAASGEVHVLGWSSWGDDVEQVGWIAAIEVDGGQTTLLWDDADEQCRVPRSLGRANDGDFLMGWMGPLFAPALSSDGCAKRVGSNGILEWTEDVGFPNFDRVNDVVEVADDDLMWVGIQADVADRAGYRTSIGRISADGTSAWARVIGYCDGDEPADVARYADGLVIVEVAWGGGDDFLVADGLLRVVDASGDTQWLEALPNLGGGPPTELVVLAGGALVVAGRVDDPSNDYFVARIEP